MGFEHCTLQSFFHAISNLMHKFDFNARINNGKSPVYSCFVFAMFFNLKCFEIKIHVSCLLGAKQFKNQSASLALLARGLYSL